VNWRRTLAMAHKELLHVVRDSRSLVMALAVPLFMLLLFGYALTLDVDQIPTLVRDGDASPESRALIQRFEGSRYFEIAGYVDDYGTIEQLIDSDEILMGLVIPPDFSQKLLAGEEADVQVLIDGSDSNTANIALGYVNSVLQLHTVAVRAEAQSRRLGRRIEPPAEARLRVLYNETLQSRNFIVPGLIAVILVIISALLTSLTIAREWEMGTMEQVLSTPLRPAEIVVGKMLAYFGVGIVDTLIAVVIGVTVFGVPFKGSLLLLAFTCCVFIIGALFWGILISAATRNQLVAYQAGMISSFLPAFMLSGFIFAIENMPQPIQLVTYIFPARYFVTILKGLFLKDVGVEVLAVEIGFLIVYSVVVFLVATRKMRQKVA